MKRIHTCFALITALAASCGIEPGSPVEESIDVSEDALIAPNGCDMVFDLMAPNALGWAYFTYLNSSGRAAVTTEVNWMSGSGFDFTSLEGSPVRVTDINIDPLWWQSQTIENVENATITLRRVWRSRIINGVPAWYLTAPALTISSTRLSFSATPSECSVTNGVGSVIAVNNSGDRVILRVIAGSWPG